VLEAEPLSLVHYAGQVFVGLSNGTLNVYRRMLRQVWEIESPLVAVLGPDPVSALLPVNGGLYTATGRKVILMETNTFSILRQFSVTPEDIASQVSMGCLSPLTSGSVSHLAVAGVGLWIAKAYSSNIALYHTESFIHLQDINIASNVSRVLAARDVNSTKRNIFVTALSAAKGLLWVGTNVGIALTIPLPRLEGVPIISGKANISYHAHFGPVRMFLPVVQKVAKTEVVHPCSGVKHQTIHEEASEVDRPTPPPADIKPKLTKQMSEIAISETRHSGLLRQVSSPLLGQKKNISLIRKSSKTLPRGFVIGPGSETSGDSVFGLYGDLMNVEDYDYGSVSLEATNKDSHRSDPELDTIGYRVGTLDRRVTMKSQRPRSLDLSSWSVTSRGSNQTTSSSETGSDRTSSPGVSRAASFKSDKSNQSEAALSRTLTRDTPEESKPKAEKESHKETKDKDQSRTVITLMGGRGYIQWRTSHPAHINNNHAHLVIWDHKI